MDYETAQDIQAQYADFLKHSSLEVVVPKSRDTTAGTVVSKYGEELQRVPSRSHIFFDEFTTVFVILRTHTAVKDLLAHLELTVSAHATNTVDNNAAAAATKHEVAVEKLAASSFDQFVKVGTFHHAAWRQRLHIGRPPARRNMRPTAYFTANLALSPAFLEQAKKTEKQFLPSFQASPANVLESLQLGQADKLHLSETRITKVLPPSLQADDAVQSLRGASRRAFTAGPAVIPRIRGVALPERRLLAIGIDAVSALGGSLILNSVDVKLTDGTTVQIAKPETATLLAGDEVDYLYELVPNTHATGQAASGRVSVLTKATVRLDDLDVELDMERDWHVDLRAQKTAVYHAWSGAPKAPMRPVNDDGEIVFDFTAPPLASVGKDFEVGVRCSNHSPRTRHFLMRVDAVDDASPLSTLAKTPDVRMDYIKAGECFEAVVRYTALAAGVLDLGLISVVDLDSKESFEVRELPSVIARV